MSFRYKHGDRPLEGYTIQRGVGRGGFGEVYYAISDGGREVALKALLLNHEIELRGVSQCINLKNPHLVSIFDVRTTPESMPFVIMEYVAGPSLRDILRDRPQGLGRETAGYFLREIGKGLAYLHDRGIVHRDLKPENIFFEDGYVKIGDYGLSKYISVSRQSGQTMSVGTVHYMAPEIGTGIYNRGIDIYALGIILYELLTGRVPFGGDSFGEIIMKHLTAKPDLSGLDGSFAPVIGRALEKRPEDRYATVDAMVEDLFREPSLQASVSVFSPAHLTLAGRKQEPPRPVSPAAETVTFGADAIARAAAPNGRPAAERAAPLVAAQDGDGPAVGLATPPHPGPGAGWHARLFGSPPPAAPPREARPEAAARPFVSPVAERAPPLDVPDVALDPLDRSQRVARALFAGGIVTLIAGAVFREMNPAQTVGFAVLVAASAWSVILSQTTLARRFKLEPGPWRRILAAALIGIPALFIGSGSGFFGSRAPDRAVLVYLLGIVLVDWSLRMDARRDERISLGRAFAASLPAFLLGIFIDVGKSSIIGGLLLAAVSLSVNALSPFVPHGLRKRRAPPGETPAHAGVDLQGVAATLEREAAALRAQHARGEKAAARRAAKPPWHLRPIHPLVRFLDYFLGATGMGAALVFLTLALFGGNSQHHSRLDAYTGAIVSGALGLFFFRRGLRPLRGKLWADMLRPFLLIGSGATLAVCLPWIGYYTWYRDQPWNSEPLWALATVATVVGVLSYVLRPWSRRRTEPSVEAAGPPERKVHLGWAGLGILLWMAGLSSALIACAATVGLPQALDLEREIGLDERIIGFLPGAAWSLTLNLVIAAAACVVVSRRQAGGGHLARAVAGQAALGCLLLLAFQLASLVHVEPGGGVEFWGDEDGLFVGGLMMLGLATGGVILLAWPLKRARPEPIPELSHA